jgi:glycosyltransferase involved in cell wall biosynthesis
MIPAYDEEATVGSVVRRLPTVVDGRPVVTLVIDDGSTDRTAERAAAAGAEVVRQPTNQGLGAAVRRGLAVAVTRGPAVVVYLDADGEYAPEEVGLLAGPVLAGDTDYIVGSRFRGEIRSMRPHRLVGNLLLTAWVRWLTRRGDLTDGQSGFRAFSPAAAAEAEVVHDYNYAQVLTLDLLGKGYRYAEVPITYSFRRTGSSFVRLGRYLRRVVPAVHQELNAPRRAARVPPVVQPFQDNVTVAS